MSKFEVRFFYVASMEVEAEQESEALDVARNTFLDVTCSSDVPASIEFYEGIKPEVYPVENT